MFERDGANGSATVVRRGDSRRLLVNGRLEATNGLATSSGGILAHLPLTVHPSEKRVLLLGLGNGAALRSVLAHRVERVDVVERGPELVAAARTFGEEVNSALDDERTRLHLGDPEDLVARSGRYDIVLHQGSGGWTELSSRLSTREFLEMAAERLHDDGIYCQWVPDDALTKTGFQCLLATVASVFPQVQVWAGHGSAVIVLARKTVAPHDFAAMLAAYRDPVIQVAAGDVWIEEPLSLLSHFLVSDEAVRRITRRAAIHSRTNDVLGLAEAARRRVASTINPVPGLFALEDDLLPHLANVPEAGFEAAVTNAIQARALERNALDLEASQTGPEDTRALDAWQTALELNPRDRAIRRRLADLRSRTGIEYANKLAVAAAHSNLRQAVEIDTTFADGFANLGRHLAMTGDYDFAIAVIEHAVEMEPDNDLFALLLAQTWKRRIYYDKALPWYEKAMELNPRNVEAAIGWVDTKLTMQENPDLEEGLAVLRRYRAFEPQNEDLTMRITRLSGALAKGKAPPPPPEQPAADTDTAGAAADSTAAAPDSLGAGAG
jgi:tetratricopeptide (TPR) repeat protein